LIDNPAGVGMPLSGVQVAILNAGDYIEVGLANLGSEVFTTGDSGSVTLARI